MAHLSSLLNTIAYKLSRSPDACLFIGILSGCGIFAWASRRKAKMDQALDEVLVRREDVTIPPPNWCGTCRKPPAPECATCADCAPTLKTEEPPHA